MRGIYRYRVSEIYKGKTNEVNVIERWNWERGIESASLFCSENHDGSVSASHVTGDPISLGYSIVLPIISRLTTRDVDKKIIQQLKKAEQLFDKEKGIDYELQHYDFEKRFLRLTYKYRAETMTLNLYIDYVNDFVYFIDENGNIVATSTLENGEYRKFIHSYASYFEQAVDYKISEAKMDSIAFLQQIEEKGFLRIFLKTGFYCAWYCLTGRSEVECSKAICGRQKQKGISR